MVRGSTRMESGVVHFDQTRESAFCIVLSRMDLRLAWRSDKVTHVKRSNHGFAPVNVNGCKMALSETTILCYRLLQPAYSAGAHTLILKFRLKWICRRKSLCYHSRCKWGAQLNENRTKMNIIFERFDCWQFTFSNYYCSRRISTTVASVCVRNDGYWVREWYGAAHTHTQWVL